MPEREKLTSLQNPKVKSWVNLHKSRDRRESGLILIEGLREIRMAAEHGINIKQVIYTAHGKAYLHSAGLSPLIDSACSFEVSDVIMQKISYREQAEGLIAIAKPGVNTPDSLRLSANPLIIILESVEKPGNLGAILRTADAVGADAVIICDPATDIYNPNVIRSSLGCVFSVQLAVSTSVATHSWLVKNGIVSFAAELQASEFYHQVSFREPSAIILGTEADGLGDFWIKNANHRIKIPMYGKVDSLNVSASAAIIAYEAARQRNFTYFPMHSCD